MYLVSPQLFVTKEHIISDKASTSSSLAFSFPLPSCDSLPCSFPCSGSFAAAAATTAGEVVGLLGVVEWALRGVLRCDSDGGRASVPVLLDSGVDFEGVPGWLLRLL